MRNGERMRMRMRMAYGIMRRNATCGIVHHSAHMCGWSWGPARGSPSHSRSGAVCTASGGSGWHLGIQSLVGRVMSGCHNVWRYAMFTMPMPFNHFPPLHFCGNSNQICFQARNLIKKTDLDVWYLSISPGRSGSDCVKTCQNAQFGAEANHTAVSLLQSSWCHRWPGPKLPARAPASAAKGRTWSTLSKQQQVVTNRNKSRRL